MVIPIHTISRETSSWADGQVFRPERWLEPLPPVSNLPSGWSNLLAFSDGPRSCVGYRLGKIDKDSDTVLN